MAPIYRDVELQWGGKTYKVTPRYELIQRIEQRVSLAALLTRMAEGNTPLSQVADLVGMCLRAAGCTDPDADPEAINLALYTADPESRAAVLMAGQQLCYALVPQDPDLGNGEAPEAGAEPEPSKTSRGASTTRLRSASGGSPRRSSGK